jgi:hypothetical protein
MERRSSRQFSQALEDGRKERTNRILKGKITGREKRLETFHPLTHRKQKQCYKKVENDWK